MLEWHASRLLAVKQLFTVKIMGNISEKSTATGTDPRKWLGRVIIGVLLGEAIWNLIVSAMNNLFVPWLGDVMGQSSGLPASFTQRPYNYPDFFVSFWESCVAAFMAAVLNYFFQRRTAERVKPAKTAVPAKPVEAPVSVSQNPALELASREPSPPTAAVPVVKPDPVMYASVTVMPPAPINAPEPAVITTDALEVPPDPLLPTAKPPRSVPKIESKSEKRREVYYNLVGEPLPIDDDGN
jgi:hypothetical protein